MSYESVQEAQTRLAQTIVMYKEQPVWVESVFEPDQVKKPPQLKIHFYPTMNEWAIIPLNDPDLNYRRFNLGYVNTQHGAAYAYRNPIVPNYKQGLTRENLKFTEIRGARGQNWETITQSIGFAEMMRGKYPAIEEAVERITTDKVMSVAFSPILAIRLDDFRKDFLLEYKGERVGFGTKEFNVPEEFNYLREVLKQNKVIIRDESAT